MSENQNIEPTLAPFPPGSQVLHNGHAAIVVEDLGSDFRRFKFADHIEDDPELESQLGVDSITNLKPLPAARESVPTSLLPVVRITDSSDMPDAVLDGRLGEICLHRLVRDGGFPISYAWPALVSAAGAMVPSVVLESGAIFADCPTNLFTGLVGPVHSGKSQAILWANQVIGLPPSIYSEVRAASSEGLLRTLNNKWKKGELRKTLCIDLDEWKFLFDKASIEHASFATFLHTAFYKARQHVVIGGGLEIDLDCALTFVGGIVQDEFDECFGARSMGGLHDRFMFGLCPDGYNFLYRPFEGMPESTDPVAVTIDRDVWEMIDEIRRENPKIGREAEIAVRVAHVCASFDGRSILRAKNCETHIKAFVAEQLRIRDLLRPNDGLTNDARCANALLDWLRRNAPNAKIAPERDVRHGLRRILSRLGPGALAFATANLVRQGTICYGDIPDSKPYAGRKPKGYQLIEAAQ